MSARRISLQPFGVRGSALQREDALAAIETLRGSSVAVLGGDAYFLRGALLELAYADWHCDTTRDEPRAECVTRSLRSAEDYIRRFPDRKGAIPLFALVVREAPGSS